MVVMLAMGLGLFAPPFGVGYYAACAIGKVDPDEGIKPIWAYMLALFAGPRRRRGGAVDLDRLPEDLTARGATRMHRSIRMSRFFGEIRQAGYVVPDIEAAMDYWSRELGVGPWFYNPKRADRELPLRRRGATSRTTRWRSPTPARCRWS